MRWWRLIAVLLGVLGCADGNLNGQIGEEPVGDTGTGDGDTGVPAAESVCDDQVDDDGDGLTDCDDPDCNGDAACA